MACFWIVHVRFHAGVVSLDICRYFHIMHGTVLPLLTEALSQQGRLVAAPDLCASM